MFFTILLLTVGLAQDDWYMFEPESKIGQVSFPMEPTNPTSRSVGGPAGFIQLTRAQVQTADGVYSVQITENAARVNPKTLDEGIRQFAASRRATLGVLQSVTVGGHPGRAFEMTETQNQRRSKVRFVASGGALFVLSAAGMPGAGLPAEADRFLNSLQIESSTLAQAGQAGSSVSSEARLKADAADADKARLKADAAEADRARIKAEADLARVKREAENARAQAAAKPKGAFSDTPDPTVTIGDADKADDESKDTGKSSTKKSNASAKVTISRMPRNAKPYADTELEDLSRSFAKDRDGFRDIGPEGSVFVGVRVTYIERFGGPKVRSAQPIYRLGKNHYAGQVYGEVVGPVTTVIARPGYAVGGLVTHTGLTVDGFGIVFMKVDGDHLDPDDSYNSPWIGDRNGGGPGEVMTKGGLVVGLQGRSKTEINALGLTSLK